MPDPLLYRYPPALLEDDALSPQYQLWMVDAQKLRDLWRNSDRLRELQDYETLMREDHPPLAPGGAPAELAFLQQCFHPSTLCIATPENAATLARQLQSAETAVPVLVSRDQAQVLAARGLRGMEATADFRDGILKNSISPLAWSALVAQRAADALRDKVERLTAAGFTGIEPYHFTAANPERLSFLRALEMTRPEAGSLRWKLEDARQFAAAQAEKGVGLNPYRFRLFREEKSTLRETFAPFHEITGSAFLQMVDFSHLKTEDKQTLHELNQLVQLNALKTALQGGLSPALRRLLEQQADPRACHGSLLNTLLGEVEDARERYVGKLRPRSSNDPAAAANIQLADQRTEALSALVAAWNAPEGQARLREYLTQVEQATSRQQNR